MSFQNSRYLSVDSHTSSNSDGRRDSLSEAINVRFSFNKHHHHHHHYHQGEKKRNSLEENLLFDNKINDENDNEDDDDGLSNWQTCVTIIKCAIGAGSFSLPYAFDEGGLYASFLFTIFLGALSAYTIYLLFYCERFFVSQKNNNNKKKYLNNQNLQEDINHVEYMQLNSEVYVEKLTYPELGKLSFPNLETKIWGTNLKVNWMEETIYIGIILTSIGVCAAYLDFLFQTMPSIFHSVNDGNVYYIILPIIGLLALLRSFRWLSFTSILGDFAVTGGIIAVIAYGFDKYGDDSSADMTFIKLKSLPRFFGATAFLFAIHIVILPIAQSMKKPEEFKKVVVTSYSFITLINALFGAICLALYNNSFCTYADDDNTSLNDDGTYGPCGNILDNIDGNSLLNIVKFLVCIDLLFTVPMVLAASREILEERLMNIFLDDGVSSTGWKAESFRNMIRLSIVACVLGITIGVPDFENMVSLVGGFVNSLMGFILPPIIYLKLKGDSLSTFQYISHIFIVIFGMFALIITTYYTINDIA